MKLSELKVGMKVWHPIWGQGEVYNVDKKWTLVHFKMMGTVEFSNYSPLIEPDSLSHLYPHPVTVISTDEVERLTELVKAQEEYIDLIAERYSIAMIVAANHGFIEGKDLVLKGVKLRAKINQLQSKTEK